MRNAATYQTHTAGPLNYVDFDADQQIAEQLAYANQAPSITAQKGFRYWLRRNLAAALGLLMIATAAAAAAALATWSIQDPSLNFASSGPTQNALGVAGAIGSDIMMQFFGLGSVALFLIFAVWGWRLLFDQSLPRLKRRLGCAALALIFAAGAASALPVTDGWPLPMGMGGVVGDIMIWLPVAAFGDLFSGIISSITVLLLGTISIASFVFSVWAKSAATSQATMPNVAAQPPYEQQFAEYEEFTEESGSRFGLSSLAAFSVGAVVHTALTLKSFGTRTARKLSKPKPQKPIVRVAPEMHSSYQEETAAAWEQHNQQTPDWADGEWAAYEDQHEEFHTSNWEQEPDTWREEAYDRPYVEDFITPEIVRPAPVQRPAGVKPQPVARKAPSNAPAPQAQVAPKSRVLSQKAAPKPGRRATREAQPDLLGGEDYELPSLHLLSEPVQSSAATQVNMDALEQNARLLEGVLEDFGVRGEIINVRPGPVVTLYELEPAPGIKSSRVIGLADDIARSMSAIAARVAVIPGRNAIGIELPNSKRETVYLRELLDSTDFEKTKAKLALCLGKTIGGEAVIADLAKMPHLLVAGTTGSGKSVAINTMILSILYRMTPEQCRLIMIDPKMLELSVYDGIPHLLTPVVTDPKKAVVALKWTVREMEDRYKKMSKLGVRNIDGFNSRVTQASKKKEVITRTVQTGFDHETGEAIYEQEELNLEPMPYIVVIIDEMADLMMVAGKEIEGTVQRLAQMARAAGIHVVMATQRPSVDVITGTIKANFPTRISFQVTSKIDSRTILGEQGAEQLLGMGDMLFMAGGGRIQRVHGPFVNDNEVEEIVAHLQTQGVPEYLEAITNEDEVETSAVLDAMTGGGSDGGEGDLYDQAVAIILRDKKASTSYVQRRLSIGYNRAASIIEKMEQEGVISAPNHAGKREILVGNSEDTI
ncbi:MAG: DNA translocase FtsK [Hyphomicrobiales bacterium]